MASQFIPKILAHPKTFRARLYLHLNPANARWEADTSRSDSDIDEQMREWISVERPEIQFIASPTVSVYQQDEENQLMVVAVSLLYIPAVEGAKSGSSKRKKDPVGAVVGTAEPGGKDTAGVITRPG